MVDIKKEPLISASKSLTLNLITLLVNNDQVNDEMHDIKETKRKTNGDLLSKKKYWKYVKMSLTNLVAFLENHI